MRKLSQYITALLFITFLLPAVGCKGPVGPEGPAGPAKAYLAGTVTSGNYTVGDSTGTVDLTVGNTLDAPTVALNGIEIPLYEVTPSGLRFYDPNFDIEPESEAALTVTFTGLDSIADTARATVTTLGGFRMHSDRNDSLILDVGESLEASWAPSAGAGSYRVSMYLSVGYTDTSGYLQSHRLSLTDSAVTDTMIMIAGERLFPDTATIQSIFSTNGRLWVRAIPAAMPDPGETSNITGDAAGFFLPAGLQSNRLFLSVIDPYTKELTGGAGPRAISSNASVKDPVRVRLDQTLDELSGR